MPIDLDSVALADLRKRRSAKWTAYPDDVIPAWVAESDFPLAQPIHARLRAAIDAGDLGYPAPDRCGVRESLAAWLAREQGWALDPRGDHGRARRRARHRARAARPHRSRATRSRSRRPSTRRS